MDASDSKHRTERVGTGKLTVTVAFAAMGILGAAHSFAQSAVTGQVTDITGGVLPGATVEANSAVLIERRRMAVTDDTGRFTIVDLRPGTYTVTVALAGFSTARYEGVEVPSSFTQTVDATLQVGALDETITVRVDSAVVDVRRGELCSVSCRSPARRPSRTQRAD